jgi:methyl-accepting chemotaxis protein
MNLRSKLTTAFLGCGLLPLLVAGLISYRTATGGMATMETQARDNLVELAKEQMSAIRDLKKQQLESYFKTFQKLVADFSQRDVCVTATRDLAAGFKQYRDQARLTDPQAARQELSQFYTQEFGAEYGKRNQGKAANVAEYLAKLDDDTVALQLAYMQQNPHPLGSKQRLDRAPAETDYNTVHAQVHPLFRAYLEQWGLYDVFLVDAESGVIIYSSFKELDFGTNLKTGPLANSMLADVYRRSIQATNPSDSFVSDMIPYYPSYETPASFISSPVYDGNKLIGVAVFQMPFDQLNALMQDRGGLGETGETLLVGNDWLPRTDSFKDKTHRTVDAAFRNPDQARMKGECTVRTFEQGETAADVLEQDYLGDGVVAAFTPFKFLDLDWALVAKKDVSEALAAVETLQATSAAAARTTLWWTLGVAAVAGLLVAAVAWVISRSIANPVIAAAQFAQQIAQGDLTRDCAVKATAEVGELIQAMNGMRSSLTDMVGKLVHNAGTLSRSSTSLSATATQLAGGAEETTKLSTSVSAAAEEMSANINTVSAATEEMSQNVRTVAAAIEEMTASIAEVADNAEKAAGVAEQAAQLTEASGVKISQLGNAASEIGKVIEVIQDIAEQTNLLALNATIEAARAGDAGKGFAVVATEVKELAKQTASATDDIRTRIEAIQAASSEAIAAISEIEAVIINVNEVSRTIAAAVEEQRVTTTEISRSVSETTNAVDSVTRSVSESAHASREITGNMTKVDVAARQTAEGAGQARDAGDELLSLAEELQGLVKEFRVEPVTAA